MKTWSQKIKGERIEFAGKMHQGGMFMQGGWLDHGIESKVVGAFCGCMHGGLTQCDDGDVLEESAAHLGWPMWLVILTERIFESLPEGEHSDFVIEVMEAVPTNADITRALHDINIARMMRLKDRLPEQGDIFDQVADVWRDDVIDTNKAARAQKSASFVSLDAYGISNDLYWSARSAKSSARLAANLEDRDVEAEVGWSPRWSARSASSSAKLAANMGGRDDVREALFSPVWAAKGGARAWTWTQEAKTIIEALKKIPDGEV